jgi:ferredoxin-NADP reductase
MFTQTRTLSLRDRVLRSPLVDLLTGPHGVDRYTELVEPTWTLGDSRAKIVAVRRQTPRSTTITLEPNAAFAAGPAPRAGQYVNLTVEVDGRRLSRCYSPANAERDRLIELTVGVHDEGRDGASVSRHLHRNARVGMVVGLDGVGGDFTLPEARPRRILFVSGGSGITPVLSMLRTLISERSRSEITFIHYARTPQEACYRDELDAMAGVRVLRGYSRTSAAGELKGHFTAEHLGGAQTPDAVFVCGPRALVDAVTAHYPHARSESFVPPVFAVPTEVSGGTVAFAESGVDVIDDGRSLLEQAEAAGLSPQSGCRMGICHTCTRRKTSGAVKNLITGAVSTAAEEDVQICVTAPVGDVELAL